MDIRDRIIVLVGLMGAGKTRVGNELAQMLHMPFVDADRELEAAAGMPIPDLFEAFGEAEFRKGERKVMERLLAGSGKVIATGGGAFIQPEVRAMVKEKAVSVWLKADLDVLVERVSRTSHRPLLRGGDPAQKLRELMDVRYPVYAEADITVLTYRQAPLEMAEKIREELRQRGWEA